MLKECVGITSSIILIREEDNYEDEDSDEEDEEQEDFTKTLLSHIDKIKK